MPELACAKYSACGGGLFTRSGSGRFPLIAGRLSAIDEA